MASPESSGIGRNCKPGVRKVYAEGANCCVGWVPGWRRLT
ncbi:hypothetical protein TERTU_4536 [Teredinibacter turnerae T7901]|uniref:Uncharacterized protein n=1 Tax=Teredinibacter turnerae (strain ATCC 39867 / T7901) TaxID=377629 RepID=C5BJQ1_TERTT|nr:hypothetical protein TERTU_4536 [Teredinibacter turnerae T7901]